MAVDIRSLPLKDQAWGMLAEELCERKKAWALGVGFTVAEAEWHSRKLYFEITNAYLAKPETLNQRIYRRAREIRDSRFPEMRHSSEIPFPDLQQAKAEVEAERKEIEDAS